MFWAMAIMVQIIDCNTESRKNSIFLSMEVGVWSFFMWSEQVGQDNDINSSPWFF